MEQKDLAREYLGWFETAIREDGSKYFRLKSGAPNGLKDLIRVTHDEMFPDDWRYKFIYEALTIIAEYEGNNIWEMIYEIEPDHRDSELVNWLGSHSWRPAYVDEINSFYPQSIRPLSRDEAMWLYEEFPVQNMSYEEAFEVTPEEA